MGGGADKNVVGMMGGGEYIEPAVEPYLIAYLRVLTFKTIDKIVFLC
jgi:hypothetical protein